MNYNAIFLTIVMLVAFLLCGSATAANVNSTNISTNFTANKLVSATPYPDMIVKNITAPSTGVKGKTITVANSIKNQGNTNTKGFYVYYYLKNTHSSKPIYIGQRYITSLAAGATNTQNTQLTIPTTIASNNYYIMAYADYTNLIKESNETNNHNYSITKINIQNSIVDLIVTSVTAPANGSRGSIVTVENSIKNQGNTATTGFYVYYYLKNTPSSTAYYIGRRYITSLAAGATNTQNTQLTIPTTIASNNYYIMAYADYTNLIKESNETNNHNYSKTKINILFTGRPVYITSDNIDKYSSNDIARINSIVSGLQSLGLYAVNYGLGPNEHDNIIFNITIPKNAVIVNIYGGVCAGTILDMTQSWYKYYLGNRSVFSIWINTTVNISNITFLQRAYDDNFTPLYGTPGGFPNFLDTNHDGIFEPGSGYNNQTKIIYPKNFTEEDGILNPGELMKENGYSYLYQENGDIQTIINAIYNYLRSIK